MGCKGEHLVSDIDGVVYEGRHGNMDQWKAPYCPETGARTLADVIEGADVFLGLSAGGVLKPEMACKDGDKPLIMALANPVPRSSRMRPARPARCHDLYRPLGFPNQVNNVLCFPYHLPGRLDVGATASTRR